MLAVLLCAGCFAQSATDIMNKYKDKKGAECVNVGSMMMGIVKLITSHDDEARDMMKQVMNSKGKNLRGLMKGLR